MPRLDAQFEGRAILVINDPEANERALRALHDLGALWLRQYHPQLLSSIPRYALYSAITLWQRERR